ncbi:SOUL family heme-binding protein [Polynucleobacter brandtiae]|uniref:SOUL heme-binding protein n=1 Tax=Polynucleobacter brandtiae TaxID=1938816 RepID=A0A2M8VYT1_9BURK|nr:heme-binding protein [Polynucleobacter brandtiae]PJI83027.1 SOUL heme-binding protein [Polynucleobacter brandtiae]
MRALFFLTSLFITGNVMATEEPKYSLLEKSESFELRSYAPQIIAQVKVTGDMDAASSQGFRLIAAYIFGQNQVNQTIAMTAPVGIEMNTQAQNAKIAMTAPVGIQADKESQAGAQQWTVSFVMPAEYTLTSLPKPINPQVKIRELPAEKKAVLVFSGLYSEDKVLEKTQALEAWIKLKGLQITGEPQFARYNPPWTLPFLRRNEILIPVRD